MKTFLAKVDTFLGTSLGLRPRGLLLLAILCVLPTYLAPLWDMTMFAPQYPDGLRLHIWSYRLDGGNGGQDVKEINVLNHYIGMRDLETADFSEFKWMPFVLGALGLLFLRAAVLGRMSELVDVVVLLLLLRPVLPLVLRLQDVELRTPSRRRAPRSGSTPSCLPCSAAASSQTSRSTPIPPSARTASSP